MPLYLSFSFLLFYSLFLHVLSINAILVFVIQKYHPSEPLGGCLACAQRSVNGNVVGLICDKREDSATEAWTGGDGRRCCPNHSQWTVRDNRRREEREDLQPEKPFQPTRWNRQPARSATRTTRFLDGRKPMKFYALWFQSIG